MKLRIAQKNVWVNENKPKKKRVSQVIVKYTNLLAFDMQMATGNHQEVLKRHYRMLFSQNAPFSQQHKELIRLKIQYALVKKDYEAYGVTELPKKVDQNYRAAQDFNVKKLTPEFRKIMEIKIK